jgi:hypothetical protein
MNDDFQHLYQKHSMDYLVVVYLLLSIIQMVSQLLIGWYRWLTPSLRAIVAIGHIVALLSRHELLVVLWHTIIINAMITDWSCVDNSDWRSVSIAIVLEGFDSGGTVDVLFVLLDGVFRVCVVFGVDVRVAILVVANCIVPHLSSRVSHTMP